MTATDTLTPPSADTAAGPRPRRHPSTTRRLLATELRLLTRDTITFTFVLAFPVISMLIIGGVFGAFAGFFVALQTTVMNPTWVATDVTFFAYTVLLLGGAARVLGPVVGSIIFWFLITFLDLLFDAWTSGTDPFIPTWIMDSSQASLMRLIVMGLALMLLMIFRPQGIFGDRRELAIDAR